MGLVSNPKYLSETDLDETDIPSQPGAQEVTGVLDMPATVSPLDTIPPPTTTPPPSTVNVPDLPEWLDFPCLNDNFDGIIEDWATIPSDNSGSSCASAASSQNSSPYLTPQRRIGEPIDYEAPISPTSIDFWNEVRSSMNDLTQRLADKGARPGVVLCGMQDLANNFKMGTRF
jgi:hypothetical protein